VRCYGEFRYGAKSWKCERRVIARIEASPLGADCRFIVTNLNGTPQALYERESCQRGQMENLIKAHKLHLASDRTSCTKATANQFRLLIHTAAYWLLHSLRGLAPKTSFWRNAQFDIIRCNLIKVASRKPQPGSRSLCPPTSPIPAACACCPGGSSNSRRNSPGDVPLTSPSLQPSRPSQPRDPRHGPTWPNRGLQPRRVTLQMLS
jgi:hypothetical protein